jgi:hypothetical protein
MRRSRDMGERAKQQFTSDDYLLLLVNVIGLAWAALDAAFGWGPWSAYVCVAVTSLLYVSHVQWRQRDILKNLLLFGLLGGVTELAADYWLVSLTKTLHYTPWGPFLIDSPAYMPMSWAGILLSMGFLGFAVSQQWGLWRGILVSLVVAGIYVPTFEALAHYADWWSYSSCPMWGVVPWYIIIGEALVGAAMVPLVTVCVQRQGMAWSAGAGILAGLLIPLAYKIGMVLV